MITVLTILYIGCVVLAFKAIKIPVPWGPAAWPSRSESPSHRQSPYKPQSYPFTGSKLVEHHFSEFATIRPWMARIESSPNCKS
jgi:hypothetical protein